MKSLLDRSYWRADFEACHRNGRDHVRVGIGAILWF